MQNHHARVVFAACLFVASAAAQGTIDGSTTAPSRSLGLLSSSSWLEPLPASTRPAIQDPEQYEMRRIYSRVHGDFLMRMERFQPKLSLGGRWMPDQAIDNEAGRFDLRSSFGNIDLPMNVSTDGYLMFGLYGEARSYSFKNTGNNQSPSSLGEVDDEVLIGAGAKFGFGAFLDDNIFVEVETRPGVFTDYDAGLHHKDFDFPSHALLTYRALDNFFLKIGARYNQVFEDAPWLPMIGFSWDVTGGSPSGSVEDRSGLRFDVLLPEHVELSFWPMSSTGILLGGEITGGEYRVRPGLAARESRGDIHESDDLRIQEVVGYLGLIHKMSDNFSFSGRVGLVLAGDYDLTNGANGFNHAEGALDQGVFVEFGFGIDW